MNQNIIRQLKDQLEKIESLDDLKYLWREYLGKNGHLKLLVKELSRMSDEKKREQGPLIQEAQETAQELFDAKERELRKSKLSAELKSQAEKIDFAVPKIGHLHPLTKTIREMNNLFIGMGYSIMDGPEIETDKYCFQRMNVPADHPARDLQDTLYIEEPKYLLRTQTSSIEARLLEKYKPPFKVVSPGRVYRNEKVNKSNHFIFHHYQGVVVMKGVNLKDLFGTLTAMFKKIYGPEVIIRYRNKYYPEVEPGVGFDMQCFNCHGRGCPLCKGVGWIEMGGSGIIHPNVMSMAGIDHKKWIGFAFAFGLDRLVMAKYKITDIRTLLGGNLGYKYYENESALQ